jgi:hypothetical protein
MARAYSQDLRDRVIDAGTSARQAAERFGIGGIIIARPCAILIMRWIAIA